MDFKAIAVSAVFMGIFVLLPIIAIMTEHQRKMARIMRGESEDYEALKAENAALKAELAELKGEPYPLDSARTVIGIHVGRKERQLRRLRG